MWAKSDSERSCAKAEDDLARVIQRSLSEGAAPDDLCKNSRGDFLNHQAARAKKTDYQILLTHYALERLLYPPS